MKTTIANFPILLDPDNRIEYAVTDSVRSIDWNESMVSGLRGSFRGRFASGVAALPFPAVPSPRINEFIDPTNVSRFGRGLFLVGEKAIQAIAERSFGYSGSIANDGIPDSWGDQHQAVPLVFDYQTGAITRDVIPLRPIAIQDNLWLLPVVDQRYRWLHQTFFLPSYSSLNWEILLGQLFGSIGQTVTLGDPVDSALGLPDVSVFGSDLPTAAAIDLAAMAIGRRAVFDGGTVRLQTATEGKDAHNWFLAALASMYGKNSPEVTQAASVYVCGPVAVDYYDDGQTWSQAASTTGGRATAPPTVFTSFYSHQTNYGEAGNSSAVDSFVSAVGTIIDDWRTKTGIVIAPGVVNGPVSGCIDYRAVRLNGVKSLTESAVSLPPDFMPRFFANQWANNYVHAQSTAVLEPRGGNVVKFSLRASGYSGTPQDFTIRSFNGNAGDPTITAHFQSGFGWLPIAATANSASVEIKTFTVTSNIVNGECNATIEGNAVTVIDPAGDFRDLIPGCVGRARKVATDRWEVLHSQRPAYQYFGEIFESLKSSDTTAKVLINPYALISPEPFTAPFPFDETTYSEETWIQISNTMDKTGRAGTNVLIQRSYADVGVPTNQDWYVADVLNQLPSRVKGTAKAAFAANDLTLVIENISGLDGIWDQTITELTIQNVHQWEGIIGNKIRAEYNMQQDVWETYQKDC